MLGLLVIFLKISLYLPLTKQLLLLLLETHMEPRLQNKFEDDVEMYNFVYFSINLLAASVDTVRFPQQKWAPSRVELVSSPLDLTQPIAGPTDQSD